VFAEKVRAHRRRLGLTQEELAKITGLSIRNIRNLEAGRTGSPRPATVRQLANAFGLTGTDRDEFRQAAAGDVADQPGMPPVPAQLPPDVVAFTGRQEQLARLDALLVEAADPPTAVVISAIAGTAGVGKTALAVHWAHGLAERYPDGQLFIDLHGFATGVAPVEPADALDRLLRVLGVPGERIPVEVDDRAGLWRSILAGRRMVIVLDNAGNEAQVAPLLPGTPGCLVLVTSRRRLAGLQATHTLSLDMLPPADAFDLFVRTAGKDRLAADPQALVVEAVELCGRLPLAIRIAAARLQSHPAWRMEDLVERLRDQDQRLAELADPGGGERCVAAALELSRQQLSADQRHLYQLLGLHPGPDIDPYAAAALADTSLVQARRLLDQLLDAHLVQEPAVGRYVFHDLVRAHARHTATREEVESGRRAALSRLLDYYRHTAAVAMAVAYPYERGCLLRIPAAATPTPDLYGPTTATEWLERELPNILAATNDGFPEHTCHLSEVLHRHLRAHGRHHDAESLHRQAQEAARTTGNHAGEMNALIGLGWVRTWRGRCEQATDHFRRALKIARVVGVRAGEADALLGLGRVHLLWGRYVQATDHYGQALQIARVVGVRAGEVEALLGLGLVGLWQDRYELAVDRFGQAREIARSIAHRTGEMNALGGLSNAYRMQGRYELAVDLYEQVREIARAAGHPTGEMNGLIGLGEVHQRQGRYEQAMDHYGQALQIARATSHRTGELHALTGLGHVDRLQGRHDRAAVHYRQVIDIGRKTHDRNWQFEASQGLGRVYHATGHATTALTHHRRALALATDLQQPADQARAHDGLAHAYHTLNQPAQARQHWRHALDMLTSLGADHTEDQEASASTIRAHLAGLDQPRGPHTAQS
jgi:tetratricopeptide (TPR) repeat protein/transcriptional regulator with XRE-family HTH domain